MMLPTTTPIVTWTHWGKREVETFETFDTACLKEVNAPEARFFSDARGGMSVNWMT